MIPPWKPILESLPQRDLKRLYSQHEGSPQNAQVVTRSATLILAQIRSTKSTPSSTSTVVTFADPGARNSLQSGISTRFPCVTFDRRPLGDVGMRYVVIVSQSHFATRRVATALYSFQGAATGTPYKSCGLICLDISLFEFNLVFPLVGRAIIGIPPYLTIFPTPPLYRGWGRVGGRGEGWGQNEN